MHPIIHLQREDVMDIFLSILVPILVGFFGALIGAYIVFERYKNEKLWQERFDTLKQIADITETLYFHSNSSVLERSGLQVISPEHREKLENVFTDAKLNFSHKILKLKLLFQEKDLKLINESFNETESLIVIIQDSLSTELFRGDLHAELQEHILTLQAAVIELSRKKCT